MFYYQRISYCASVEDQIITTETIGVRHRGNCINSSIKNIIKRRFYPLQKDVTIDIIQNEFISEEEAIITYGNHLVDTNIKQRLRY